MLANKTLEKFFDDNFGKKMHPFLMYKDKQLLKEKSYRDFAEEQLKKSGRIYLTVLFAIIYGVIYGIFNLIDYGRTGDTLELILGLVAITFMVGIVFYSTKEYYTIKSSMDLFLKLLDENQENED